MARAEDHSDGESVVRFGPFRFDRRERLLFRDGDVVALTPKALDMLELFVRNAGRVLDKESLMRGVWPDTFVDEANLSHHVFMLRRALGDDREGNRLIETIPRRGYRFVAPLTGEPEAVVVIDDTVRQSIVVQEENEPVARSRRTIAVALAALAFAAALVVLWRTTRPHPAAARTVRFAIAPPPGTTFTQTPPTVELAVSPDGQTLALVALEGRRRKIYVRSLDALTARALDGTEDGVSPFWSPDGKWIGFFAGGFMKKVPLDGGPVQIICPARGGMGSWNRNNQIIFFEWGAVTSDFVRLVSTSGGAVRDLGSPKKGAGWFPSFLPDGRHFIYFNLGEPANAGLYVGSLDGGPDHQVSNVRSRAEVHGDDLYYVRESVLVKQKFDLKTFRTIGDPVPLAQPAFCFTATGAANFSVSGDGSVVVWQRRALPTQLVWRDWNGRETGRVGKPELYRRFSLSPDGQRLAVDLQDPSTQGSGIWIHDIARGVSTRITPESTFAAAPLWTHQGDAVLMSMQNATINPGAAPPLTLVRLSDGAIRRMRPPDEMQYATSLTADDQGIVYTSFPGRFSIVQTMPVGRPDAAVPLESSPLYDASDAVLSPDDRWLAFQSTESGRPEIYLRPFRGSGEKIRVSSSGGTEPQWTADGRAVLFLSGGMLMRADVVAGAPPRIANETPLFPVGSAGMMELALGQSHYAVGRDRILVREIPGGSDAEPVAVLIIPE